MIDTPAPSRSWRLPALIAGLSMLAGSALTVAVLLLGGWRHVPVQRFDMTVVLKKEATAQQRDALGAALRAAFPGEALRVRTKEEIFEAFRTWMVGETGELPASETADAMQEQLIISTSGRSLDCDALKGISDDTAVDRLDITRTDTGTGRESGYSC
ncbi:hypothetical protein Q0Z83_055870 [Actinoplanes sichuanensis]|uniref:FtsX extracellular domain-containing protein n=1 Tax=Actinoplanes sichuanensis TaxID=512349 RepID=A0ABW4ARG3_9ACTN|nr:hypothetical protein [Actinoplanes sichuanensis]BEL07396.1 hypothetical protein Q0Z83_055870 [Actinoplanes sichuanensis]